MNCYTTNKFQGASKRTKKPEIYKTSGFFAKKNNELDRYVLTEGE